MEDKPSRVISAASGELLSKGPELLNIFLTE